MKSQIVKIPLDKTALNFKLVEVPEVPLVEGSDFLQNVTNFVKDILFLSSEEEQLIILDEYLRSFKGFVRSLYALENTAFAPTLNDKELPLTKEDEGKFNRRYSRVSVYKAFQDEMDKLSRKGRKDK